MSPLAQNLPAQESFMTMTTDTTKSAADFFTAGNHAFKENLEKSMAAVSEMNAHSRKNLEAMIAAATATAKGFETVGARAMAYSKKSMEDQIAAAKALASAKSIQEAVELQTTYAKTAFENLVAEANEMSETVSTSVKGAMSPINERVTALVERVQTSR
jgi:phasin family protein